MHDERRVVARSVKRESRTRFVLKLQRFKFVLGLPKRALRDLFMQPAEA